MGEPRNIIIAGNQFSLAQPFDEGHVCTAGEAKALNQLFAENVRNNLAEKVKGGLDQAGVTEYANSYEFSVSAPARQRLDPVEAEARKIAKGHIRTQLASMEPPTKIDDYEEDAIEAEIDRLIAEYPAIMDRAKAIVKEREKTKKLELGSLNITASVPPAAADEAPTT